MNRRAALCAIVLAFPIVPTALAQPVSHLVVERVDAAFVYRSQKGGFDYLVLYALRRSDPYSGKVVSSKAYAGRGTCTRSGDGGVACQTKVRPYRIARFRSDESFTRVAVVLTRRGHEHRLVFSARDDYSAVGRELPNECGGLSVRGYEVARSAVARGVVFGRKVSSRSEVGPDAETVGRYLEVSACP